MRLKHVEMQMQDGDVIRQDHGQQPTASAGERVGDIVVLRDSRLGIGSHDCERRLRATRMVIMRMLGSITVEQGAKGGTFERDGLRGREKITGARLVNHRWMGKSKKRPLI